MVCHVATVRNKAQWKLTASSEITLLVLLSNISTISNDVVVFGVCLYNVWGIWKLKRESGIQTSNDLVTILFKQSEAHDFSNKSITDQETNSRIKILVGIQHQLSALDVISLLSNQVSCFSSTLRL